MEFTFLFMDPLPTALAWCKAIEFVCNVLQAPFVCVFVAMPTAAKDDTLTRTGVLDSKLDDLVNSCALLTPKRDFALP
jgi:hypothetical protein